MKKPVEYYSEILIPKLKKVIFDVVAGTPEEKYRAVVTVSQDEDILYCCIRCKAAKNCLNDLLNSPDKQITNLAKLRVLYQYLKFPIFI